MPTFGFLVLWALAIVAAFLIALAGHYSAAFLAFAPPKLIDGFKWRDHALNQALNSDYVWFAHYDENGWWEFYSLRNYMIIATAPLAIAIFGGMVLWSDRATHIARSCAAMAKVGLVPLFCR